MPDPYRILGLPRGATVDEVKRAYRRLVKANHPDAAGPGALARFLAIQAAYEQLVGPAAGSSRSRSAPRPRPSAADADRAEATRRAYGERSRRGTTGQRPGAPGGARPAGPGPRGAHGPSDGQSADETTDERPRSARSRGKATLGSTSYDDAEVGAFEPDWGGASWYGTTSGTYWTINPKEYADPRKHGPEYQARARRASAPHGGASTEADASGSGDEAGAQEAAAAGATIGSSEHAASGPQPPPEDRSGAASGGRRRPTHTTTSWWDSTAGAAETTPSAGSAGNGSASGARSASGGGAGARTVPPHPGDHARNGGRLDGADRTGRTGRRPSADAVPGGDAEAIPDPAAAAADLGKALTDPRAGGLRGRIVRAVVGWLPVALGLGWLVGEVTGCGRFAATCDPSVTPLAAVGQVILLGAFLLVPEVAALAAGAALVVLVAAVAASLVLSATGDAADETSRRAALGALLIVAWLTGLGIALVRRIRSGPPRAGPVS